MIAPNAALALLAGVRRAAITFAVSLAASALAVGVLERLGPSSVMDVYPRPALITQRPSWWPKGAARCELRRVEPGARVLAAVAPEVPDSVSVAAGGPIPAGAVGAFEHVERGPWAPGLVGVRVEVAGVTWSSRGDELAIVAGDRVVALLVPGDARDAWESANPMGDREWNFVEASLREGVEAIGGSGE